MRENLTPRGTLEGQSESGTQRHQEIGELQYQLRGDIEKSTAVSLEAAREIMGRDFLGSEEIERAFGRELRHYEIPAIPFSEAELVRAKELGQFLVLRSNEGMNGMKLTMENMYRLRLLRQSQADTSGTLDRYAMNPGYDFFAEDVPSLRWALVTKDVIPGSLDQKAVEQTRILVDYIKNEVFRDQQLPEEYAVAICEFEDKEAELLELQETDWNLCAYKLSQLAINRICRRTPVEVLFDCEDYFYNRGERLLHDNFDRTARVAQIYGPNFYEIIMVGRGHLRDFTNFDAKPPMNNYSFTGVVFTRNR